jgi:DNA-binding MarR family transcriptional regulator
MKSSTDRLPRMASRRPATAGELATGLARAMIRLRARLRTESAPQGDMRWTWSQLMTLSRVASEGPTTGAALAAAEHVRPQSMHETIATLRDSGLVATQPDPDDGRKLLVSATQHGRELVTRIPAVREAWLEAAIAACADEHELHALATTIELMERLADCELGPGARPVSRS